MAATPEQLDAIEQQFRSDLNRPGTALNKAKTDYLSQVSDTLSQSAEYKDPNALKAKLAEISTGFDEKAVSIARDGANKGGKPAAYTATDPTIADKLAENMGERVLNSIPIIGPILAGLGSSLNDVFDFSGMMDTVKGWLGIAPTYTANQKAMAGALQALEKQPITFHTGDVFVLDNKLAARAYDQSSTASPDAPTPPNNPDIKLTPEQQAIAVAARSKYQQANASPVVDHSGMATPGSSMTAGSKSPGKNTKPPGATATV